MARGWRFKLALLVALLGLQQLGQGGYIQVKALVAQQLLQQAWIETLQGGGRVAPWPWADTWPIARLKVPRLGVDQIVLAGASGRSLAFGPGHVAGTALPGKAGNSVLSGHRDTHFEFLRKLEGGDRIEITLPGGEARHYLVAERGVYHQSDVWLLSPGQEPLLRLITCYPFDSMVPGGPERYVVTALPAPSIAPREI